MKRILTLLMCLTVSIKGFSQTSPEPVTYNFSVQEAVDYALNHKDSVVNARLDVTSADYRVKEIIGQGLPQINGQASFQDYLKVPTTLLPGEFFGQPAGTFIPVKFGVKYQSNLAVSASQLLFDPSYIVGLQSRKTYKELYNRAYTRTKIDVISNVTKAYYQVLVSNEQIKLLDANIAQLKQQVDQTTAQNKQGFVEKIDVDRIAVQYNNLVTTRENTLRLLALNYQLLKFQIGMPINANLTLKDRLTDVNIDANAAETATDTTFYKKRIEYGLLETNLKLSEFDLKRQKAQFLPTLSANASYASSYQNNSFRNLYSTSFPSSYIGLTLNVPIFSGFQRTNRVKQSAITVQKNQNNLNSIKNALALQAEQAKVTYINSLQSLNNQKRNQELAREVLRVAKIKYEQGVGSSIEVTQAQTGLENADNSYVQSLYDALVSKVDLDKAYGRIQ
ncbi:MULTISPECIES: TolC family protein [unclassified Mucilaginibacter]|uniref:TolC family protein n=1 Tax=unclassified Mucilaginibacter TaxID=2617802 RepID=UPI000966D0F9|nr:MULTISPECIES: TolC family protein [unclassified Mucilaginibacter]OJW15956.1 MAG: transporter [Mucilaginibacter sp. 44-25]PLW89166.1 MAG: TolC family protein [Mucilaginibacter sp.]PMP64969.1 MAG: TolC family protein [Mucilaginibacter sp.]HEK19901.1 TolC family protein [Bacteroidota bacterium]